METEENNQNLEVTKVFKSPRTYPMLSPENWERIFNDLHSPIEFLNVINTCMEWNELFHSKKVKGLLPLVLPLIFDYLPAQTIIKCRRVNKCVFKELIDATLLNCASNPDHLFDHDLLLKEKGRRICLRWKTIRNGHILLGQNPLRSFLRLSRPLFECGASPLLTGNMTIKFEREWLQVVDHRENIFLLLTRFGHRILSISMDFSQSPTRINVPNFYAMLALLPNLKDLRITTCFLSCDYPDFTSEALPPLPDLISLCFSSYYPYDIMPFLNRYGSQLKVLNCIGTHLESVDLEVESLNRLLPNLSHLKVNIIHKDLMRKLANVNWKLEQLSLFETTERGWTCSLKEFLNVVRNFKETLTNIELIGSSLIFRGSLASNNVRVSELSEVPNLKKITTAMVNLKDKWFKDFLKIGCKNLVELHYQFSPIQGISGSREDVLQARRAFDLCPKLNRIEIWLSDNRSNIILRR